MKGVRVTISSHDMMVMATRLLEHLPRLERIEVEQVVAFQPPSFIRAFVDGPESSKMNRIVVESSSREYL